MPRFQRILCPTDFSDAAAHAIEQAFALARGSCARLTLLHVYRPMFMPVPGLPPPTERVSPVERERVRCQLQALVEASDPGGATVGAVVEVGRPAREILDYAVRWPADLVVMGTHGASGFAHLLLGSVTETVIRRSTCPVLTVPPRTHATSRLPFARVLCGVDFSEWSIAAVELAASIAEESRAALDLAHVVEWPWHEPPGPSHAGVPPEQAAALDEYRRYVEAGARARLEGLAPAAARACAHVCHGKPYVELLRLAADLRADLVVLGVHSRNPLDLAFFGSTANQVVRQATCPVLTVRR